MSAELAVWNFQGERVGKMELPAWIAGLRPSGALLHEAVTAYLSNQRRWTAHTKTRSEVSGGGRKPWKQKHTGRARAGSNRSPLWRKGGVVFGPRRTDPAFKRVEIPRRKEKLALAHALAARAADGGLRILDSLSLDGAKTRQVAGLLKALGAGSRSMLVVDQLDRKLVLAARNIGGLQVRAVADLHPYAVLRCHTLILTRAAWEKLSSSRN